MKRVITVPCSALILVAFAPSLAAAAQPIVLSAIVNYQAGTLTIDGQDFGSTPTVIVDNITFATVSASSTEIVANFPMPPSSFLPGTYDLTVAFNNKTATFSLDIGANGPQGPQGVQGPPGPTGPQGPPGAVPTTAVGGFVFGLVGSYLGGYTPGILDAFGPLDANVRAAFGNPLHLGVADCKYRAWGDQVVADFYIKFATGTFTEPPFCTVTLLSANASGGTPYLPGNNATPAPKMYAPILSYGAAESCTSTPGPSNWDDGKNGFTISLATDKSCGPTQLGGNGACLTSGIVQLSCIATPAVQAPGNP